MRPLSIVLIVVCLFADAADAQSVYVAGALGGDILLASGQELSGLTPPPGGGEALSGAARLGVVLDRWGVELEVSRAAETYLREFPDGPFAPHVTRTLAYFYDDLYKVIRFELAGERIDYKYSCYQRFLSNRPREQLTIAQRSAILYYRKAIALLPGNRYLPDRLREMEKGPDNGWHYCAD